MGGDKCPNVRCKKIKVLRQREGEGGGRGLALAYVVKELRPTAPITSHPSYVPSNSCRKEDQRRHSSLRD